MSTLSTFTSEEWKQHPGCTALMMKMIYDDNKQVLVGKSSWLCILMSKNLTSWRVSHGRPQEFFQRGAKPCELAKMAYFLARRRRERKFTRFFRRFRLNLRVIDASAEGANENFKVFCRDTAYYLFIFKFQGGGKLPQVAPPSGRLWVNVREAYWL